MRDDFFEERLPDVALVELRVPDHHDEALGSAAAEVVGEVTSGEGPERRRHGAESHRAGGEIHHLRVLAPARIGLEAPEAPELLERRRVQASPQILDGVERRRRVRLDGDHVGGAERLEVEGGHEAHDGGGGRLVAAHLRPVGVGAEEIGVVDHPGAEPEHLPLDPVENREIVCHPSARTTTGSRTPGGRTSGRSRARRG